MLINYGNEFIINQNEEDQYLLDYFLTEIDGIQFDHPVFNKILETFRTNALEGKVIDSEYLMTHGEEDVKRMVVELSTSKHEVSDSWNDKYQIPVPKESDNLKNLAFTNILRLKFRIIQHLVQEENLKLKEAAEEQIESILEEIESLKMMEMEIAAILGNVITK
ncbi:MAG: hypothetical protein AAFN93_20895 [Bacteroidota bacterium]